VIAAEVATVLVVTVKIALVAPAGMVTLAGTVATDVLLLESEMTAPPLGAGALSVTAPVEGDPPVTLVGFSVSEARVGPGGGWGVTVSEVVCVTPAYDAEIVTGVELATAIVVTCTVARVSPAATVMLAGTVAAEVLLLDRETTAPPLGAGPLSITVPVDGFPPLTLVGLTVSALRVGLGGGWGVTVSGAVCVTPAYDAEIVTGVELATAIVVTCTVARVSPAATVMLAGTVAAEVLLLDRETTVPPLGAGPLSITVPVDGLPPLTLVGLTVSADSVTEPPGGGGALL